MTDTKAGELAEVIARVRDKATAAKASRAHLDAQTGRYSGGSVQCVLDVDDALACADAAIVAMRNALPGLLAAARERELFAAEKARVEVLYMDARREREQLLLHVRDAEAEAKRAGERESELCGLLEELKGSAAEQQAEREQLRGELEQIREEVRHEYQRLPEPPAAANNPNLRGYVENALDVIWELRRERDEARAEAELRNRMYREATDALRSAIEKRDDLQAALLSQQQATDEAMRRAEEARRELASFLDECQAEEDRLP